MALSAAEYKTLIVLAVGDDTAGTLAANIDLLWESHDTVASIPLVASLTKRDAIDLMLGRARTQVSFRTSSGSSVSLSDLFDHLLKLRAAVEAEIAQAQASATGAAAIGTLTQTAPIMRDTTGQVDPNGRRTRGDPLR
jgi:hypothetical protein